MDNIFFLSCFLPLALVIYRLVPGIRGKNAVLLVFSLLFYSFSGVAGLVMLIAVALVNYLLGMLIACNKWEKVALRAGVVLDLAFLGFFKYANFLLTELLGLPPMQIGIARKLECAICEPLMFLPLRSNASIFSGTRHP